MNMLEYTLAVCVCQYEVRFPIAYPVFEKKEFQFLFRLTFDFGPDPYSTFAVIR